MNISREEKDTLNAVWKMKIEKDDYEKKVNDVLKDYRKKVKLDGFRPGMVPFGLVKKLYYNSVLVEEVNKLISESLSKYIFDEKLRLLGDPLPSEDENKDIDWEKQTDFEFSFDIGMAPEMDINLTKRDKIPYFRIKVDEKMLSSYIDNYARRFGEHKQVEKVETGEEVLTGKIVQILPEGTDAQPVANDKANFSLGVIKDEEIKKIFMGAKVGDHIPFDLKKAFPNDTELSGILQIDKEKVAEVEGDFDFVIDEISLFENAEVNQALFDNAFGKDTVKSEEEFKAKVEAEVQANLDRESEMRFGVDVKDKLVNKLKLELPVDFLKRWLIKTNEGKFTVEEIEKDFDHFRSDLEWQLIKDEIIRKQEIQVTEEEILNYAREVTLMQFLQYGLANIPGDQLDHYAKELIGKEEERKKLADKLYEDKVVAYVKEAIKVDEKSVSAEEFDKLFEKK
jgi:trigger factor